MRAALVSVVVLTLAVTGCTGPEELPTYESGATCQDSLDNDGDGQSDCSDTDCAGAVACLPTLGADALSTPEDTALVLQAAGLLANDVSGNSQPLSLTSVGGAVHGSVVLEGTQITFTPDANFAGQASFRYLASAGSQTSSSTVSIEVVAVNDAAVAVDDALTTAEDTEVSVASAELVGNDLDVEENLLTVTEVGNAVNGSVALSGAEVIFTPAADFSGTASFQYTLSDGSSSDQGLVLVTVTAVNDAPVPVADAASTEEEVPAVLTAASLLANDSDVEGDLLTLISVGASTHGTAVLNTDDTVTFTPAADFHGEASFEYAVSDGTVSRTAQVVVTVTPVNDAPVAVNDSATTAEDAPVVLALASLSGNDTDVDGDPLTVSAIGSPLNGSLSMDATEVTFTPDANFHGAASFQYTVTDGTLTAEGTVTVTVTAVNDAPVAVDDTATTEEETPVSLTATLLANDTDLEGDLLTVSAVSNAVNGTVALVGTEVTFTPAPDFHGAASFQYTLSDGTLSDEGSITVTVTPVNDAPVAVADSSATDEDGVLTLSLADNDTDVDGDSLSVSMVGEALNGTPVLNGDGTVTFTPAADFSGAASFEYTVTDGSLTSNALVSITVNPVNDAPVAVEETVITLIDTAITVQVLANDTDVEADPLEVTGISAETNGTAVLNPDGSVAFTPAAGFLGTASFRYAISDGTAAAEGLVLVTVTQCGDGVHATFATTSIDFEYLATACYAGQVVFTINGVTAFSESVADSCTCSPGIRLVTVTDPAVLGLLTNGDNTFQISFPGEVAASWAITSLRAGTELRELVLVDVPGNALSRPTFLCDGYNYYQSGNVTVDLGEACDDGNHLDRDGCSATCEVETCGNGVLEPELNEQCDDGNYIDADGCSTSCQIE